MWKSTENHSASTGSGSVTSWLPRLELLLYFAVWSFGVFYSIYRASKSAIDYLPLLPSEDFDFSWNWLGRAKDVSDTEWAVFSNLFLSYLPCTVYHVCVSHLLKRAMPNLLPYFYSGFSLLCMVYVIGALAAVFLIFQIVLMYVVHLTRSKWLCWTMSLSFLVLLNQPLGNAVKDFIVIADTREEYLMAVTIAWINCRCLSFCMVQCEKAVAAEAPKASKQPTHCVPDSLVHLFAYCLYFPVLFSGPLIMYDDFERDLCHPTLTWTWNRVLLTAVNVVRYTFWFTFNEVILHYAYLSALHYQSHFVEHLPLWSLCGLGYGMSQFFMTKYTVLYGFPSTVASMEGFSAPPKPKCIARIHLYSDMWKYFDCGLYTFLKRYIYIPIVKGKPSIVRKILGAALCFVFVYTWHGMDQHILIWTLLNFFGVVVENCASSVVSSDYFKAFQTHRLSQRYVGRLKALAVVPLLLMSAVSNFYFICGLDVGNIFMRKIVINGWSGPIWIIAGFLYCMCHVSEAIRSWELQHGGIKPAKL